MVSTAISWDMTKGELLFPTSPRNQSRDRPRGKPRFLQQRAWESPQGILLVRGGTGFFSIHCLREGSANERALAGDSLSAITERTFWEQPGAAWRYTRLMEVGGSPGSTGNSMIKGVAAAQYRGINESPVSEQSREHTALL